MCSPDVWLRRLLLEPGAEESTHSTAPADPVCNGATEPALVRLTEVVQDQMKVSLANAEDQPQKDLDTITQLKQKNSDLTDQVVIMIENMGKCKQLMFDHSTEFANLIKECVQDWEKTLKVSLAKAEKKQQKAVKIITQLEKEKSDLTNQLETLKGTVRVMEKQLSETHLQHAELRVSLANAEEQHQKDLDTITQLKQKNSDLTDQVVTMIESMEESKQLMFDHSAEFDNLIKECVLDWEETLKVSIAKAEKKQWKAVKIITQLEKEKSDLTNQLETLKGTVRVMEKQLSETHLQHAELRVSLANAEEQHQKDLDTITQLVQENSDLTDQVVIRKGSIEACKQLMFDHSTEFANLIKACVQDWEEILKVSLAKAEHKQQKAAKIITQLEKEKSDLTNQLETLKDHAEAALRDSLAAC
ncbi:COP1-interactive protein 1-like isoform X1 [Tachysurus fulvidraco]|uniref:COP1-interactive protein 1-like isoform X1 n=1 Tax=Tachysurus fulvidraco TaxID=1234273 RepID=UPI001FEE4692|nr:COP1-interactive protein 1-like isoform X1 [Tachysurus fulvidraco]